MCNHKAIAGATSCPNKSIREDAFDAIVLEGLLGRVLEPSRLKFLLADVLDRSDDAEKRRKEDWERVRRERVAAETRLRRLLELVAEWRMSPQDLILAEKRADGGASIASLSETERGLVGQLGARECVIDDAAVEKFGKMLRAEIMAENSQMRRAYVRMLVGHVSVNDNEIVIAGSKAALAVAVTGGGAAAAAAVPSFDREWCPKGDKTGNSNCWTISLPREG